MILPDHYWIQLDPDSRNPTGKICHGYYGLSDKPMDGLWILVKQVEEPVED